MGESHHADRTVHPTATRLPGASVGTKNRDSIPARSWHLSQGRIQMTSAGVGARNPSGTHAGRAQKLLPLLLPTGFALWESSPPPQRRRFSAAPPGDTPLLTIIRSAAISPESCKSTPRPAHPGRAVYQSRSDVALEMKRGGQLFLRNTQKLEINYMSLTEVLHELSVANRPTISRHTRAE